MHKGRLLFMVFSAAVIGSCANKIIPEGGEIDRDPPVVKSMNPPNGSTGFASKTIIIEFDEFIELKEPSSKVFISPPVKPSPVYSTLKKRVTVKLPDSLASSTTYTLNFGDAVVDVHEANPVVDLRYIFSTGSKIDSSRISGRVTEVLTREPGQNVIVVLYPEDIADSLLLAQLPEYYSRTDSSGNYTINNVRSGIYTLAAIEDDNGNYLADLPEEQIGFSNDKVVIDGSESVNLVLFRQSRPDPIPYSSRKLTQDRISIRFTGSYNTNNIELTGGIIHFEKWNQFKDSLVLYCQGLSDSTGVIFNGTDTVWSYRKSSSQSAVTDVERTKIISSMIKGEDSVVFRLNLPVKLMNEGTLLIDSIESPFRMVRPSPSGYSDAIIMGRIIRTGQLKADPGTFISYDQQPVDTVSYRHDVLTERESGALELSLSCKNGIIHIVQLVDQNGRVERSRSVTGDTSIEFYGIPPSRYTLRSVMDVNANGKWDTGDVYSGRQPEAIIFYDEELTLRANWTVQLDWNLTVNNPYINED